MPTGMPEIDRRIAKTSPEAAEPQMSNALIADLDRSAERAADFLRAAAHPGRLRIICQLLGGEQTAGQLVRGTGMRGPALSQQAAILEAGGIIDRRRDAQSVYYRLAGPEAAALAKLLHKLFCRPTAGATGRSTPRGNTR